jgi:chromosomal replication initiator protein
MSSLFSLWEKTLKHLEKEISGVSYETWIKEIKPVYESNDTLYFEVSNELHKNIIDQRYKETIKAALVKSSAEIGLISNYIDISPVFLTKENLALLDVNKKNIVQAQDKSNITLNPNYTFDTFVVGNSNKFAHAASVAVAEAPGRSYNPLFLYGGVGLGKTHLMHAIGNHISVEYPEAVIMYVTSETFTNELIASLASNQTSVKEQFRNKYRRADVLLIDDIQFIAGKVGIQEEFFHTFNTLYESNKQIVISSDKPPKEIVTLEERLRSRFEWGLIADIQPPDYETKVAILLKKAIQLRAKENNDLKIENEILHFIASKATSNIRELEGALQKVIAYARLYNNEITMDLAAEALKDFFSSPKLKRITNKDIIDTVCEYYDISEEDIKGKKKHREVSYPRQVAMYLIRELTDISLPKIGEIFGGKDHTTVIHAIDKISTEIAANLETEKLIKDLTNKILE